ncbi:MAG: nucleotidyltransferase domain-containing protein [Thermoleophilia bacterium]|nr:nucleotidyltransferase domain-containing protein [Thermoleophilia bacterium]
MARDDWIMAAALLAEEIDYPNFKDEVLDTSRLYNGHMNALFTLAEEVGVNERTLRRAVNRGTFRATRPTPRKLDISLAEKVYIRRSWTELAALRASLRTEPNVRFAMLFGSMARGDFDDQSDIDLLVEMRATEASQGLDLALNLQARTGRDVDILAVDQALANPHLLIAAMGDGRLLVDRDSRFPEIQAANRKLLRSAASRDKKRMDDALAGIDRLLGA